MALQEKSTLPQIFIIGVCLVVLSGLIGYFLMRNVQGGKAGGEVLSQGSSSDEDKLVEAFLGRPFNADRYKKFLSGE